MAIAYDAVSVATSGTSTLTWDHVPVGTPRGVIVYVIQNGGTGTDEVTGVTYGGVSMAELPGSPHVLATPESGIIHTFTLYSSVPTGTQSVVVSVSGSTTKQGIAVSVTASTDVEAVDIDVTVHSNSVLSPSVTMSLSGRASFVSLGGFVGYNAVTSVTPLASWTARHEELFTSTVGFVYTYDTIGTTDVTAGFTGTASADDAIMTVVALAEVVASTPGDGAAIIMVL